MKLNLVDSYSGYQILNGQKVNFGSSVPSSPSNGDLWFEPGARFAQPWEWNSSQSVWLSQPVERFFTSYYAQLTINASQNFIVPIEFYSVSSSRIYVMFVNAFMSIGAAHDASNYYSFRIGYHLGDKSQNTAYTCSTDTKTLGLNGWRRLNEYPNVWLPGNAWTIYLGVTKNGAPSDMFMTCLCVLRYARP